MTLEKEEIQVKECKVCKVLKKRVLSGKFNAKDKRWKSPEGGYWNGHVCAECHRAACAARIKKKRSE